MPLPDDHREIERLILEDLEMGLGAQFPGGRGALTQPDAEGLMVSAGNESAAVPWVWTATHTQPIFGDGSVKGLQPTGADVTIHGVTLLRVGTDDQIEFSRYVDWLGALAPLGVGLTSRPILDRRDLAEEGLA